MEAIHPPNWVLALKLGVPLKQSVTFVVLEVLQVIVLVRHLGPKHGWKEGQQQSNVAYQPCLHCCQTPGRVMARKGFVRTSYKRL